MTIAMRNRVAPTAVAATGAWVWAVFVTALGVYWTLGGAGYPFGANDINGFDYSSLLTGVERHVGGPAITAVGIVALVVAALLHGTPHPDRRRNVTIAAGVTVALALIAVVADGRMILLLPPLGLFPIAWAQADWPTVFQALVVGGAALFLVACAGYAGRTRDPGQARDPRRDETWIRVGRWATYVAMVCPMPYAVIRLAWSRGWSLGAPEPFVASLLRNQPENVVIEPVLAAFALGGATLTLGLLCRWGRIFPRWIPVLRGRPVPLWFPLGLGGSAAIGLFGFGRGPLLDQLGVGPVSPVDSFQLWGQPIQEPAYWGAGAVGWLFFPLWSISLALALVGYAKRAHRSGVPGRRNA